MTITTDELRKLLDEWDLACRIGGLSVCQPIRDKMDALSPNLARRVIAAEKLVEALQHLKGAYDCSDVVDTALREYEESK